MKIPLFPLETVLFPEAALPLHIFESRYREMIGECLAQKSHFGVVHAQREGLAVIGCMAEIISVLNRYDDGRLDILCRGRDRFEIENLDNSRSFLQAEVDLFGDDGVCASRSLREECMAMHFEIRELLGGDHGNAAFDLDAPISFQLASVAPADLGLKQELLGLRSDAERTERLRGFYAAMLPKLRLGSQASKAAVHNGHIM